MGNFSKIMMIVSLVCVIICFGASMWLTFTLKGDDADAMFYVMDVLFFGAILWIGVNIRSMSKKGDKE